MEKTAVTRWGIGWLLMTLMACQSMSPYYNPKEKNWESSSPDKTIKIHHTLFLIGDAGNTKSQTPVLAALEKELKRTSERGTVVFLGDNIYPSGLPPKESAERAEAEQIINNQLGILKGYDGNVFFIPGNSDWNGQKAGGRDAIRRQEAFIEEALGRNDVMQPGDGCGDPKAIKLENDLTFILLDSQWFLHNWNRESEMNVGCEIKTRDEFKERLEQLIDENDDGHILIALHHPIFTNGPRGGYFSLQDHLFPLTRLNKALILPLPGIGSLYPAARYVGISPQDIGHPLNQEMVAVLQEVTYKKGNIIFASGHEHALQYFRDESIVSDRHYIVSGTGSKKKALRRGGRVKFTYGKAGFAKLSYYEDGSVWLEMIRPIGDGQKTEVIFRKQVKQKSLSISPTISQTPLVNDSIMSKADDIYEASKFKELWFGKVYRDVWGTELKFPVLDLKTNHGGLTPVKTGGGYQTKSLRLVAEDNRQYVIRSVKKDATLAVKFVLPDLPKNTVISEIVQDQIAMSNPYSAWIVPPLAEAAGVPHSNPTYYYVPKQPALGDFNAVMGDQVYLFEERPTRHTPSGTGFGNSTNVISTPDLIRELQTSNLNQIDQKAVLRARLFDMLIGDWDRHDDQWRWREERKGEAAYYQPIPRDRDQVFALAEGIIPFLLSSEWALQFIHDFDEDTKDVAGLAYNARFFDRSFLVEMDEDDWIEMAEELKKRLTDEVIEKALKTWPEKIYKHHGSELTHILKVRKDGLGTLARTYYKKLAKEVDITGSDGREKFTIERLGENQTKITILRLDEMGEQGEIIYQRTFIYPETKEVRLYGQRGKDEFYLTGKATMGTKVRIIGGEDHDQIVDESEVGGGKRTIVYDTDTDNTLKLGREAKNRTSLDLHVNTYDRKAFKPNSYLPLVKLGFNVDDGPVVGGGIKWTRQGFRKDPFKSEQLLQGEVSITTGALKGMYTGEFIDVFGKTDFFMEVNGFAPTHVVNYFGLGNETEYTDEMDENFDFNRLRLSQLHAFPAFQFSFNGHKQFIRVGPEFTLTNVEQTEGRFIEFDSLRVPNDFESKYYGGLSLKYEIDATDHPAIPRRGLKFKLGATYQANLLETGREYGAINAELSAYYTFYTPALVTIASRIGGGSNWGNYEFFQAQRLGRRANLRGFRGERFAGDASFFHNTDIRLSLFRIRNKFIPFRIGLIGFFDHGRVWFESEQSEKWHRGYGGGITISPLSMAVLTATYNKSEEFDIFELKFGFFF